MRMARVLSAGAQKDIDCREKAKLPGGTKAYLLPCSISRVTSGSRLKTLLRQRGEGHTLDTHHFPSFMTLALLTDRQPQPQGNRLPPSFPLALPHPVPLPSASQDVEGSDVRVGFFNTGLHPSPLLNVDRLHTAGTLTHRREREPSDGPLAPHPLALSSSPLPQHLGQLCPPSGGMEPGVPAQQPRTRALAPTTAHPTPTPPAPHTGHECDAPKRHQASHQSH